MDNNLSNFSPLHSGISKREDGGHIERHDSLLAAPERSTFTAKVWENRTVAKMSLWVKEVSNWEGWGRLKYTTSCSAPGDYPIQKPPQKLSHPPKLKLSLPKSYLHSYSCCFLFAASTFKPCCGFLYPCWDAFRDTLLGSTRHEADSVLYYLIKA